MSNGVQSGISSLLIATDGSIYADVATECSAWLAARLGARLTALYVIDARRLAGHFIRHISEILKSFPSEAITDRVRAYYHRQGEEALRRAEGISERFGVKCHTKLETGNVVKVIADESAQADLLVIGERGEDEEFETGFLGSVAEKLVRKVDRPVLLTGLRFREFRRALLAYDGSEAARAAMKWLARLAVALGMEVEAVQMVEEGESTAALNDVISYFKDYPVHLSTHHLTGDSHSVIIDHAKEIGCDLMVMAPLTTGLRTACRSEQQQSTSFGIVRFRCWCITESRGSAMRSRRQVRRQSNRNSFQEQVSCATSLTG